MIEKPLLPLRQPSEIVLDYLEKGYLSQGEKNSRIPTIEQISAHLSVSASTVRNVIRKLTAEGRLGMKSGQGLYDYAEGEVDAKRADIIKGLVAVRKTLSEITPV